ncbi:hypothetical protein AEYBE204_15090 [Asticcacaulis sp. YBE204]|nr:hypothetical protein AEYBE204_15090 [Asticcacaulis sp. YBE204]
MLPFSQRLARDNGWSVGFAELAMEEYRKFIYLACVSGRSLTPSDAVDQVWHLHLTYSYDYWEVFCPQVLGRKLHHGPTQGGAAEGAKYRTYYSETLDLYREAFGEPPPALWPPETRRFGQTFTRLDRTRVWVLPKAQVYAGMSVLPLMALAACTMADITPYLDIKLIIGGLVFIVVVILVVTIKAGAAHPRRRDGSGCSTNSGCSSGHGSDGDSGGDSGCGSGCGGGGGD